MNLTSLDYEMVFVLGSIVAFCYTKTLKHLLVSRCTSIRFGCISCERQPLADEVAIELAESPEVLEIRS
jgi:hypothetical protein